MQIKKMVDFESLTEAEREALDLGEKTEEDLIREWEERENQELETEKQRILGEAQKAKELADNYKIRAEKAEKAEKSKADDFTPKNELSQMDIIALVRADIADEDMDDIRDYARLKKIAVKDALNSSVIKTLLAERKEERITAEATSTGNNRAGSKAITGNELLRKAESGEFPESDDDVEKLVNTRFGNRLGK